MDRTEDPRHIGWSQAAAAPAALAWRFWRRGIRIHGEQEWLPLRNTCSDLAEALLRAALGAYLPLRPWAL